jgi:hypothetical protein
LVFFIVFVLDFAILDSMTDHFLERTLREVRPRRGP